MTQPGNINKDVKVGVTVFVGQKTGWDKVIKISKDGEYAQTAKGFIVSCRGYVEIWNPAS